MRIDVPVNAVVIALHRSIRQAAAMGWAHALATWLAAWSCAAAAQPNVIVIPDVEATVTLRESSFAFAPSVTLRDCGAAQPFEIEFVGADRRAFAAGARNPGGVASRTAVADAVFTLHDVYAGIDLALYGQRGNLEYDFRVATGVPPDAIHIRLPRAERIRLLPNGDLTVQQGGCEVRHRAPVTYQDHPHGREVIPSRFRLNGDGSIGFDVGDHDRERPLVIDPIIDFSTYLGGSNDDSIGDIGTDAQGNIYISGKVGSMNFPGLSAASLTNGGSGLRYVAKLDPLARAVQYVTAVGGGYADLYADVTEGLQFGDRLEGFAVDTSGATYVAAYSTSKDYPAAGGVYTRRGVKTLYKLDTAGRIAFEYTLDPAILSVRALAIDAMGNVYLAGTAATGLRTTSGVVYPSSAGVGPFAMKIDPTGPNVVYSTYLSQPGQRPYTPGALPAFDRQTTPLAITVDAAGRIHVTGQATSHFAATPGAVNQGTNEDLQSFVARLNPTASAYEFVARIGGYGMDRGTGIAVAPDGSIVVVGKTLGQYFPTVYGFLNSIQYQTGATGLYEAGYVMKLSSNGSAVLAASMVAAGSGSLAGVDGESTETAPLRVALDADGNIWIAGTTSAPRIVPLVDPLQAAPQGMRDALVLKLSPDARRQLFATTLGGVQDDLALAIAVAPSGGVFVTGRTSSADFPAVNALQGGLGTPSRSYQSNGFLTRLGDAMAPITLTSATNPADAGQRIEIIANVAATAEAGSVEFRRAGTLVATLPLVGGVARLGTVLPPGVHAFTATYRGPGVHDGARSTVFYEVVNPLCN